VKRVLYNSILKGMQPAQHTTNNFLLCIKLRLIPTKNAINAFFMMHFSEFLAKNRDLAKSFSNLG